MRLAIGALRPCALPSSKSVVFTLSAAAAATTHPVRQSTRLSIANSWDHLKHSSLNSTTTRSAKLSKKWMEYQGSSDWEGLLDPLDDNLRSEILRYGGFVDSAYRSFDFDPASPSYATCRFSKNSLLDQAGFGGSGYRLTKNLRATCGVEMPRWIQRVPRWMSTRSSWIGYVAVCHDKDEIARLGRRDVVIAYRGTATCLEWVENLRATLTCLPQDVALQGCEPMVESGFLSLYTSRTTTCPSLQHMIREEIARVIRSYGDEPLSFTITGHSLGAALATLTAYDIASTFDRAPLVTVISFGGPRVGNQSFRCQLEKSGTKILRIVNSDDLITKVPGFVIDNKEVADKRAVQVAGLPSWLQKSMVDRAWAYAEVGKELRLSSKESPYLDKGNVATCHDLKTYLHLVNCFVSSTCPFRATAKVLRAQRRKKGHV
ncbi:hypothetical protein L1049_018533 [Liquidambar formosana]|uniref:Fungal lipase-type domain-containing protein n=1 Tax=Liquidambar formosana TaxID=63359 RepID=A0AAP0RA91_LIQFO